MRQEMIEKQRGKWWWLYFSAKELAKRWEALLIE
jgi:hypothetical protein